MQDQGLREKAKLITTQAIETDYLVVGCGAPGMGLTDSLIDASDFGATATFDASPSLFSKPFGERR